MPESDDSYEHSYEHSSNGVIYIVYKNAGRSLSPLK